jgi:hypothetical protein
MVLVVQALRPDRLQSAMHGFACGVLGLNRLDAESVNLMRLYEKESSASEPILILMAPGTDPSQVLPPFSLVQFLPFPLVQFPSLSLVQFPSLALALLLRCYFFHPVFIGRGFIQS